VANSTGTLAMHVAGNLRHFVGAQFGSTGYQRDREREFAARDLDRAALKAELRAAWAEVDAALRAIDPDPGDQPFGLPFGPTRLPTDLALVHLATHLAYHLGQADVHRRIVTGERRPVGAMGVQGLTES
jgi:hypothetical protein